MNEGHKKIKEKYSTTTANVYFKKKIVGRKCSIVSIEKKLHSFQPVTAR